jgi:hypothetical protein
VSRATVIACIKSKFQKQNASLEGIIVMVIRIKTRASITANRSNVDWRTPSQNIRFGDTAVREETPRCLCICQVLANQRDALAGAIGELPEEFSKSLVEPGISELAASEFAIDPGVALGTVA